jgi:micrococcal nuclease
VGSYKWPIAFIFSLTLGLSLSAKDGLAETLTAAEARNHIGETATVCGKVVSANFAARSRGLPTFLNLDQPYPHQIFTILIWGRSRGDFGNPEKTYSGKSVCVTGAILEYRGTPEMILSDPSQISAQSGFFWPLIVVLILCAAGGSSFWYFRVRKRPIKFDEIKLFGKGPTSKK